MFNTKIGSNFFFLLFLEKKIGIQFLFSMQIGIEFIITF
jgi:hypothetical protein